jgi:hypothetical protein
VGYLAPRSLGVGYPCRPALLPNWDGLRPLRTTSQLQEPRQWGRREGFIWGFPFLHAGRKLTPVANKGEVRREHGRPQARNAQSYRWLNRRRQPSRSTDATQPATDLREPGPLHRSGCGDAESQTVTPLFCVPPIVACLQTRCDQPRYRRG